VVAAGAERSGLRLARVAGRPPEREAALAFAVADLALVALGAERVVATAATALAGVAASWVAAAVAAAGRALGAAVPLTGTAPGIGETSGTAGAGLVAPGPAAGAVPAAAVPGRFEPDGVAGDGAAAERLVRGERLAMAWRGRGEGSGGWRCWGAGDPRFEVERVLSRPVPRSR
jgi:hypothetical protein